MVFKPSLMYRSPKKMRKAAETDPKPENHQRTLSIHGRMVAIIKRAFVSAISGFGDDELMTRAAALAFYSALSLAPLLILAMWVLSMLHSAWQQALMDSLTSLVGAHAADAVTHVVDNARSQPHFKNFTGLVGVAVMFFTASAVFAQLQGTLNRVWRVKPKPGAAVSAWLRARAHAFALLVGVGFMLIVSFIVSGMIHSLVAQHTVAWEISEGIASLIVFTFSFGAMYKVLPDAKIDWADALNGAVLTAILFMAGEGGIGLYIGQSHVGDAYGPAGAFVVLLTWVYYSSIIVLIGAELTWAFADARGKPIRPDRHAVETRAAPLEN
jgi:Predicted membrane protein